MNRCTRFVIFEVTLERLRDVSLPESWHSSEITGVVSLMMKQQDESRKNMMKMKNWV